MYRNSLRVIAVSACIIIGCRKNDTAEDFAAREHAAAVEAANLALSQSDSEVNYSTLEEDSPLQGVATFAKDFAKRFNEDKEKAFEELVNWDGISADDRKANMKLFLSTESFIDGLDGKVRGNPAYQTFEEYGSYVTYVQMPDSELQPPPTHLIMIHVVNVDENINQVWYPVAESNGRYHICAAKSKPSSGD